MPDEIFERPFEYRFDPNEIDISVRQVSLYYLLRRLELGEIDLFTKFQRNWDIWSKTQQSRLIESLLIRIPIPSFYFDGQQLDKWQVIDGLQRVSAFKNFILDKKFRLEGLEFFPQFNGCFFNDLPRELQRRIEETSLTIFLINKGTPEDIKYVIFSRLNTGGINLTSQELRFALNQGKATDFLLELSETKEFLLATSHAIRAKRMQDLEFINRFIAFYLFYDIYSGNLDTFLNGTLFQLNNRYYSESAGVIKDDFIKSMIYTNKIFGENAFRRVSRNQFSKRPIIKSLFDTVSVNLARLSKSELEKLVLQKEKVNDELEILFEDPLFNSSISAATSSKRNVEIRFHVISSLFRKYLMR